MEQIYQATASEMRYDEATGQVEPIVLGSFRFRAAGSQEAGERARRIAVQRYGDFDTQLGDLHVEVTPVNP